MSTTTNRNRKSSPRKAEVNGSIDSNEKDRATSLAFVDFAGKKKALAVAMFAFALLGSLALHGSSSASSEDGVESSHTLRKRNSPATGHSAASMASSDCTVWIAPSSIKGHAGYGIYTTRNLKEGESIIGYSDGISISVESLPPPRKPWMEVWHEYWWRGNLPDHASYEYPNHVFDLLVGLGTYPNHHCILGNLDYKYARPPYDDTMVDRFSDPGTGAFTYNNGKEPIVYKDVSAGHEIFLNYGYCDRNKVQVEWSNFIVMDGDFRDARKMIRHYSEGRTDEMDYDTNGNLVVYKKAVSLYTYDLLPKTKSEFDEFMEGTTPENLKYRVAERSLLPRNPEWVRKNGMCMMNIIPKKSTIPSAGRGAFAQYPIKKGAIISPLPLLQLVDKDFPREEVLVNYCFKHKDSSMMLCPMSNAALINHCSTRTKNCGSGGPNAEYRWASDWDPSTAAWRQMSLSEIAEKHERGLSFEIVALRDIEPGEEIFLDYGVEWEEAWAKHVEQWKPPPQMDNFITAKEANDDEMSILGDFISGDLRKTIDHPHLFTACQYWADDVDDHRVYSDDSIGDWKDLSDEKILERYSDDGQWYSDGVSYTKHQYWSHWPCTIIRQEPNNLYTVRIHQSPFHHETTWEKNNLPRFLTGYHREGIHYFVKPLKSDQHLPGVFRHPIGIRDEIFPDKWKDLR